MKIAHIFSAAALSLTLAGAAMGSAFWPGTVVGVAANDVLNIRKWPSAQSKIIGIAQNGAVLSLTGRCKNIATNASFQIDGPGKPAKKHAAMKAPNVWCQVMTDDAGPGWVRGRFIWPA